MVFCFFQEYKDDEVLVIISDVKLISINYLKGSCFLDLLACVPFSYLLGDPTTVDAANKDRLFMLLKLLRFPRLLDLLEVDRVKEIINQSLREKARINQEPFPIIKALM